MDDDPWALPETIPLESLVTPALRDASLKVARKRRAYESAVDQVRLREAELEEAERTQQPALTIMKASARLEAARRRAADAADAEDLAAAALTDLKSTAERAAQQVVQPDTPQLLFRSLPEFVEGLVCPTFRRELSGKGSGLRWSAEWFKSAEAIMRLEAMWRSFESLRLDGSTGISMWLRDHADYHLNVLMSPDGPFSESRDRSSCDSALPCVTPPEGMFPVF